MSVSCYKNREYQKQKSLHSNSSSQITVEANFLTNCFFGLVFQDGFYYYSKNKFILVSVCRSFFAIIACYSIGFRILDTVGFWSSSLFIAQAGYWFSLVFRCYHRFLQHKQDIGFGFHSRIFSFQLDITDLKAYVHFKKQKLTDIGFGFFLFRVSDIG